MCGIYGSINKFGEDDVKEKIARICYRGPDFSSVKQINDTSYFAHNRLAIIDLDARSNQPFSYEQVEIVYNGEIYNYQELASLLTIQGHTFSTSSDTEVICAAYLQYGEKCVDLFNGMFSFVIYDKVKGKLFGARDRLGKKPLFYIYNKDRGSLEFCSQLSPLVLKNKLTISWPNVSEFLFWGYNQDPNTPFNEVKKIPAGNFFVYDIQTNLFTIKAFWRLPDSQSGLSPSSYADAKSALKNLLIDSVKIRMISDVPLGIFLSGGIDSSLIAAISQNIASTAVKTFSISFREDKYDEGKYARKVAQHLGTQHNEFYCDQTEVLDFITNFEDYFDEPFGDMSAIPTLLLCKKTKERVTVALSGDGGDEIFAGYERYRWMNAVEPFYRMPKLARELAYRLGSKIPNYKINMIAEGLKQKNVFELYCKMVGTLKPNIFSFDFEHLLNNVKMEWDNGDTPLIDKLCRFDIKTYLNNDINTKVDRAAMRSSLETRAPLMDYRVVEFAQKLPLSFKYLKGNQKRILKDILFDYLPKDYFDRPKAGFAMPLKEWFRSDLRQFVLDHLTEENLKKIPVVNSKKVFILIDEHMQGKANHSLELWRIIVWIKFYKKFVVDGN